MARVEVWWAKRALDEPQAIGKYIARDHPAAANRIMKKVFKAADRSENFPRMGEKVAKFPLPSHRKLVVPPCRAF